jgi:methionyl-tRNA formyltransferase
MKIAFFGTSNRSEPILEVLHENFDLALCVTKSNRIVGRAKEEKETVVKEWAQNRHIPVFEIEKMKTSEEALLKELITREIDLIIVADFGFIIIKSIIANFENRIINIHFSLLPKYRGANPVQVAIINGDTETGITFLQMVYELDAGDIISQIPYQLNGTETSGELYEILFKKAAQELPNVIDKYIDRTLKPRKQNQNEATFYYSPSHPKSTYIYKEDAKINWQETHVQIERKIRAFNPWPIAWAPLEELEKAGICQLKPSVNKNLIIKIYSAKIAEAKIIPISVQVEGKKITDWKSFTNGYCQN